LIEHCDSHAFDEPNQLSAHATYSADGTLNLYDDKTWTEYNPQEGINPVSGEIHEMTILFKYLIFPFD
jgi:hypothetical protein